MIAIIFIIETECDCNVDHKSDYLGLQSRSRRGPNMIAISVTKGTRFDCNVGQERD